jgi:iron complex outermembrane recepter protein
MRKIGDNNVKKNDLLTGCIVAGLGLASLAAQAADASSATDSSYLTLGEVTVSAEPTGPLTTRDVLTSVDVLTSERLEDQSVDYAWELYKQAPGVMTTEFNQGTTSGKFSFRAFNGEGEINAVKLLIDGIPSNSNDGNMPFIDLIFPLEIESIEVVRGTNDARYGLNNIAGNSNITTRSGGNYLKGRAGYGSFGSVDAQLAGAMERGGLAQNYFFGVRSAEGYRDHSEFDRFTFGGKWFYTPASERITVGLIARWFENDADEPGYLTFADTYDNPTLSYPFNSTDGGKRQIGTISGHLDVNLRPDLFWTLKSYANYFDDERWVKFSAGAAQQERLAQETQYGAITTLTYRPKVGWLNDLAIEGGLDLQQQDNNSDRFLTVNRARTSQTRNQNFDVFNTGGYLQAAIKPVHWLKLVPGVRADHFDGELTNQLNGRTFDMNDYGTIWQPKFSAVVTPIEGYNLYGNWGRTFQIGLAAGAYKIPPRTTDLSPSINDGWEVGLKFKPVDWFDGRIAYWEQLASDEVRRKLNDPTGDSENLGETKRRGLDFQFNVIPLDQVNLWFAYSLQEAEVITPGATEPTQLGKEIDHTPDFILSGGIDYRPIEKLRTSLWAYAQGDYYPERTNATAQFGDYFLINATIAYQLTKAVGLEFQARNLTDEYYEYVWHDGTQTLHSPGDERAFYGTINVQFDLL